MLYCIGRTAGRDVSNGTYRIDAVRAAFQRASRKLEALARGRRMDDTSINYLQVCRLVGWLAGKCCSLSLGGTNQSCIYALLFAWC